MSDRFTEHLASYLGIPEDAARQMLAVFNGYLFEELERSGVAVIPDVGSFYREDGSLVFEVDTALASVIDARNTGLDEIAASRRGVPDIATETSDPDASETDDDLTPGEAALGTVAPNLTDDASVDEPDIADNLAASEEKMVDPEEGERPSRQDEAEAGTSEDDDVHPSVVAVHPDAGGTPDVHGPADDLDDASVSPEAVSGEISAEHDIDVKGDDSPQEDDYFVDDSVMAGASEAPPVDMESGEVTQRDAEMNVTPQNRPPVPPDRNRSGTPWLLIGVIVIVLGIGGLLALAIFGESDQPAQPPLTESLPQMDDEFASGDAIGDDMIEDDVIDDEAFIEDDPAEDLEPAPQPQTQPGDPLFGDAIDMTQSRYTLVITSLPSQGAAETVMNSWRNRGFRAAVFAETIDGVTRYRVGVGQFDTIAGADAARSEGNVAADLPEGTWVYRYPASTSN